MKSELFLKIIIEPQEGTVEIEKEEPTQFVYVFTHRHIFSHEQTGFSYDITKKEIVEVKYKKLEIFGFVSDDVKYPCNYKFNDDELETGHFPKMVFEFDPDKIFLKQYLTQQRNRKIKEIQKEIIEINENYDDLTLNMRN